MITLSQVLSQNSNQQQQQQPPPPPPPSSSSLTSTNGSKIPGTKGHLKSPSIQITKTSIPSTNKPSNQQISQISYGGGSNVGALKKISTAVGSLNCTPKKASSGLPTVKAKTSASPQLSIIESACNSATSSLSTFQVSSASTSITRISNGKSKTELEPKSDESTCTISTTTKTLQANNEFFKESQIDQSEEFSKKNCQKGGGEEEKRQSSESSRIEASQMTDDEDKEILGVDEFDAINPVDDNDEEFKKFLNSDEKVER